MSHRAGMQGLPRKPSAHEEVSGLTCPECFGALGVRTAGRKGRLVFRCRVGHLYSMDDVIAGKEHRIEEYLWAAITALNELAALLADLRASGRLERRGVREARIRAALSEQQQIRDVFAQHAPTVLRRGRPDPDECT